MIKLAFPYFYPNEPTEKCIVEYEEVNNSLIRYGRGKKNIMGNSDDCLHLLFLISLIDHKMSLSDFKSSGDITTLHSLRAAPANHQ